MANTNSEEHERIKGTEILWDSWGVPHIFAENRNELGYAFGRVQAQNQANLLLRLYGQARGRGAEYWGAGNQQDPERYLATDTTVHLFGLPQRAHAWHLALSSEFRAYLTAFVDGINDYVQSHRDCIERDVLIVLPVQVEDVLAHVLRLLTVLVTSQRNCLDYAPQGNLIIGSNAWAISAAHTQEGKALLLGNPHIPWTNMFAYMEAQLVAPDIAAYGAALVGFPVLNFAFNEYLGWSHTVNFADVCDVYRLTPAGDGYLFDGEIHPFEMHTQTIKIKQPDGTLQEQDLLSRRSIHGPVVEKDGQLLALRAVAIDQFLAYGILEQWWDMARAKNLTEFQQAMRHQQIPGFSTIYADRDGHILSLFGNMVPVHEQGDWNFWSGIVPGDHSDTLWTRLYPYDELPIVIDPGIGWVQNSNSPPWWTTYPPVLDMKHYAPSLAAPLGMNLREQRAIRMLREDSPMSYTQLITDKFSARMELADRVLDELIVATHSSDSTLIQAAADVLVRWDRQANADSRGAVLFYHWWLQMEQQAQRDPARIFAQPQEREHILTTPSGLASSVVAVQALEAAARQVQAIAGGLDVPWGEIYRLRRGAIDLPAPCGGGDEVGVFSALGFLPAEDGIHQVAVAGDTFIYAVQFSQPMQAQVLLTYGNASQPDSPHYGDQLRLYAQRQMRPLWWTREEIMAHLEAREECVGGTYDQAI